MKQILQTWAFFLLGNFAMSQVKYQDLPVNPSTGLVCILDSVKVGAGYSIFWIKAMVDDWANYTAYQNARVRNIFNYNPREKEAIFGFNSIYENETYPGKYFKDGTLNYLAKANGKTDSSDKTNGQVIFRINLEVRGEYIVYEFTRFSYSSLNNELAKFEDPAILSNDGVHYLPKAKMPWPKIKRDYYARLQVIGGTLKEYLIKHYAAYIKH